MFVLITVATITKNCEDKPMRFEFCIFKFFRLGKRENTRLKELIKTNIYDLLYNKVGNKSKTCK